MAGCFARLLNNFSLNFCFCMFVLRRLSFDLVECVFIDLFSVECKNRQKHSFFFVNINKIVKLFSVSVSNFLEMLID